MNLFDSTNDLHKDSLIDLSKSRRVFYYNNEDSNNHLFEACELLKSSNDNNCAQLTKCQEQMVALSGSNNNKINSIYNKLKVDFDKLQEKYNTLNAEHKSIQAILTFNTNESQRKILETVQTCEEKIDAFKEHMKIREMELLNEIQRTDASSAYKYDEMECHFNNLLEEANRKWRDSNTSNNTLRSQLMSVKSQYNQSLANNEERIKSLEDKLLFTESQLKIAQEKLFERNKISYVPTYTSTNKSKDDCLNSSRYVGTERLSAKRNNLDPKQNQNFKTNVGSHNFGFNSLQSDHLDFDNLPKSNNGGGNNDFYNVENQVKENSIRGTKNDGLVNDIVENNFAFEEFDCNPQSRVENKTMEASTTSKDHYNEDNNLPTTTTDDFIIEEDLSLINENFVDYNIPQATRNNNVDPGSFTFSYKSFDNNKLTKNKNENNNKNCTFPADEFEHINKNVQEQDEFSTNRKENNNDNVEDWKVKPPSIKTNKRYDVDNYKPLPIKLNNNLVSNVSTCRAYEENKKKKQSWLRKKPGFNNNVPPLIQISKTSTANANKPKKRKLYNPDDLDYLNSLNDEKPD